MGTVVQRGSALGRELAWDYAKGAILMLVPTVPTIMAWLSARANDLPLFAVIPICAVVFAGMLSAIRSAMEITSRVRIKGGLVATGLEGRHHPDSVGNIDSLTVALILSNVSGRILQFEVIEIRTVIGGRVNPNPRYMNKGAEIVPMTFTTYADDLVPCDPLQPGQTIDGTFEITLHYGTPGKLKHELKVKYTMRFMAKDANEIAAFSWFSA